METVLPSIKNRRARHATIATEMRSPTAVGEHHRACTLRIIVSRSE